MRKNWCQLQKPSIQYRKCLMDFGNLSKTLWNELKPKDIVLYMLQNRLDVAFGFLHWMQGQYIIIPYEIKGWGTSGTISNFTVGRNFPSLQNHLCPNVFMSPSEVNEPYKNRFMMDQLNSKCTPAHVEKNQALQTTGSKQFKVVKTLLYFPLCSLQSKLSVIFEVTDSKVCRGPEWKMKWDLWYGACACRRILIGEVNVDHDFYSIPSIRFLPVCCILCNI